MLISAVINHVYVMKKLPAAPYEIWLKRRMASQTAIINDQRCLKLSVERVDYASQSIIQKKTIRCSGTMGF